MAHLCEEAPGIRQARSRLLESLAAVLILLGGAAAQDEDRAVADGAPGPVDVSRLLEPVRAAYGMPALGGAVVHRDRSLLALGVVGHRVLGGERRVTPEDLWHLGSCTKAMTATLVGCLVEKGRLRFEQPVAALLAGEGGEVHPGWEGVTLQMLLAHRGGAPRDPPATIRRELKEVAGGPPARRLHLARRLLEGEPAHPPGSRTSYSNTGYMLAAAVVEQVTGRGWRELMQEEVFAPLEIASAGFGPPGSPAATDQPRGHRFRKEGGTLEPVPPGPGADNPAIYGPAGRVHMSLAGWTRFVQEHLRGAAGKDGLLLEPGTWKHLQRPPAKGAEHALGWVVTRRGWAGGKVLTHAGSNTMWYCVVWAAPVRGVAVMAVCNAGGPSAPTATDQAAGRLVQWWLQQGPGSGRPR